MTRTGQLQRAWLTITSVGSQAPDSAGSVHGRAPTVIDFPAAWPLRTSRQSSRRARAGDPSEAAGSNGATLGVLLDRGEAG